MWPRDLAAKSSRRSFWTRIIRKLLSRRSVSAHRSLNMNSRRFDAVAKDQAQSTTSRSASALHRRLKTDAIQFNWLSSRTRRFIEPNAAAVIASALIVRRRRPKRYECGHGEPNLKKK